MPVTPSSQVFKFHSLGARFILVVVIILAATLSTTAYVHYESERKQLVDQLLTRTNMLGNFVALVSPDAILGYDFVLLDEYMREISQRKDVIYSVVTSPSDTVVTSFLDTTHPSIVAIESKDIMDVMRNLHSFKDVIVQKFTIEDEGALLGTLHIGVSTRELDRLTKIEFREALFQNGVIIFLLSLAIYMVFRYNALRPIRDLIFSSQRVADGDLSHRAKVMSKDELGSLAISFNHMTESLKASYDELNRINENLSSATKAKSAFLANMSHEIRTPLTAIIGFAESLLDASNSDEEKLASANTIIRNGNHLQKIINDILDISKIEADKLEVEQANVSPIELLQDVADLVGLQARGKNLDFELNFRFPLPTKISTDPLRLKQVLINLCGNAIKFTESGKISIDVSCDEESEKISFSVIDTGIGLNQEQLNNIFEAFTQADSSTTRKYGGTGLGLPLSKRLTEMLGGGIKVQSTPGVGSCFTATVSTGPLVNVEFVNERPKRLRMQVAENHDNVNSQLCGKILLAEDTVDNQRLISLYVSKTNAHLTVVANGQDAVDEALKHHYDLILMDMQMPVMSGLDAVSILRKKGYEKPIVALTANALQDDIKKYNSIGCNDFIAKPINRSALFSAMAKYLPKATAASVSAKNNIGNNVDATNQHNDVTKNKLHGQILLVEDTKDNQLLISRFVKKVGAGLSIVENGKEAIEAVDKNSYDLILMDMQMPVMGGLEATQILRSQGCRIPIIAVSANSMKQDISNYYQAGCDDFIAKPLSKDIFFQTLTKYLSQQTPEETLGVKNFNAKFCSLNEDYFKPSVFKKPQDVLNSIESSGVSNLMELSAIIQQLNSWYDKVSEHQVKVKSAREKSEPEVQNEVTDMAEEVVTSHMLGEDPEFDEIITTYVEGLVALEEQSLECFKRQDWQELQEIAHKLKGSGAAFGFPQLTNVAYELHETINAAQYDKVTHIVSELQDLLKKIYCGSGQQQTVKAVPDQQDEAPIFSQLSEDDPELLEVVDVFLDGLQHSIESMNQYFKNSQWQQLKSVAHNIKGSGGAFGYPQLTEVAKDIHDLIKQEKFAEIQPHLHQLNRLGERISAARLKLPNDVESENVNSKAANAG